jgi:hypothetical protein
MQLWQTRTHKPMLQLIHITATYSNAMLVAILPHISDCAKQLDLPIQQPITAAQITRFSPSPYKDFIGGGFWLTNRCWFVFDNGYVHGFRSPDDWFTMADEYWDHLERYVGKDNMTTNEAVELARNSFRNLGYEPKKFHVDDQPTNVEGPYDNKKLGHIPCCRVEWNSPEATNQEEFNRSYHIQFDIDMHSRQVVGMSLSSKKFFRPDPNVDVVPELESDYRKRIQDKMFFRTNAPAHYSQPRSLQLEPDSRLNVAQTNSVTAPAGAPATNVSPASPEIK